MNRRMLARGTLATACAVALVALLLSCNPATLSDPNAGSAKLPPPTTDTVPEPLPVQSSPQPPTLVLFDTTGEWAPTGQVDATFSANLAGRFGPATRLPVQQYTAGLMSQFRAVIYEGSSFDEPLPEALLNDITIGSTPVVWAGLNIWKLGNHLGGSLAPRYGFETGLLDPRPIIGVRYQGVQLSRAPTDGSNQFVPITVTDSATATPLGTAVAEDGTEFIWAVHSRNLTYVSESPYTYMSEDDRYLAWADLLIGAIAPDTPTRHRALVRLEDIGPASDPRLLRSAIDVLVKREIPFTMAVYPLFLDPRGVQGKKYGASSSTPGLRLDERPAVVRAIKYGLAHGGTIVSHGYTHQYGKVANPYDGVSAKDFEFYRATVNTDTDNVDLEGPVKEDSVAWATKRVTAARRLLAEAGIPMSQVTMFEFPHYSASVDAYQAVNDVYRGKNGSNPPTRYERGLYFPLRSDGEPDYSRAEGQFFPYPVTDVYGSLVVPENLGNIIEVGYNNNAARLPQDIIENARSNLVVRDGVASFFYHPYLGPKMLAETVDGIADLGYQFVSATSISSS